MPRARLKSPNVIPARITFNAQLFDEGKQCLGRQALEVADSDIEGVTLTVAPGVEIKGHLGVDGQSDSNVGSLAVNLVPKIITLLLAAGGVTPQKRMEVS